ncbi:hypothetical protein ColLi_13124 [Colletotrichum liriopes]|uniref:Uncharacterized protein n=1 Tax=Colletotrichum liriopes TaxID=708192 RepID=A0AA37GZM2_9PEZI|nr:hypothetical protein ColLi_13124 [Colletotrichum liriopes]
MQVVMIVHKPAIGLLAQPRKVLSPQPSLDGPIQIRHRIRLVFANVTPGEAKRIKLDRYSNKVSD